MGKIPGSLDKTNVIVLHIRVFCGEDVLNTLLSFSPTYIFINYVYTVGSTPYLTFR